MAGKVQDRDALRGKLIKAVWIDCGVLGCTCGWTFCGDTPSEAKKKLIKLGWVENEALGWVCPQHSAC